MPGGHEVTPGAASYFFLSHPPTHGRPTPSLTRFREDLGSAVRNLAHPGSPAIYVIESESPVGRQWPERMTLGLSTCRSFVALCSGEYFSSESCGKEWQAFTDRATPVIPVLWQKLPDDAFPGRVRAVRLLHIATCPTYQRYGLSFLLRHLPEHRAEYEAVVRALASRVAALAEHEPPAHLERPPEYAAVPNAFARDHPSMSRRARVNILIAAPCTPRLPPGADPAMYGPDPSDWKPYVPDYGEPITKVAERLAEVMDFEVFVEALEDGVGGRPYAVPTAPTLLIIDAWAALDPVLRRRLNTFDMRSAGEPWIRPLVVWHRENPHSKEREADLEARLYDSLRHCRSRNGPDTRTLDGLETISEFIGELPAVLRRAERLYFSWMARHQPETSPAADRFDRPRFHGPGPGFDVRHDRRQGFPNAEGCPT